MSDSASALPIIKKQKVAAKSRLFTIEAIDLEFSNGETRTYERMLGSGRGAVMVIPVLNKKEFMLISEYSAGVHRYELCFPKGLIDPGETPEQAANRELKEEIGFGAKTLIPLKSLSTAPGYFNATMHIFLAFDLYEESLPGDEPEPLQQVTWRWDNLSELLLREDFSEARSVAALYMAQEQLINYWEQPSD